MTEGRGFERLAAACSAARLRAGATAACLVLVLGGALVLLLSLLPASAREGRGSVVPLLLVVVLLAGVCALAWLGRAAWQAIRPDEVAEEADAGAGLGEGDVRAALELGDSAGSRGGGLARLHCRRVSEALARAGARRLLPVTGPGWKRRSLRSGLAAAAAVVLVAVAAFARPQPMASAAAAMGAPWRTAFPAPLLPIGLDAPAGVPRGEPAPVAISAPGRASVMLAWRAAGRPPMRQSLAVAADGSAAGRTAPVESPTQIWVEDAGERPSDTLLVRPLEPLLVQDVQLTVEYATYLGREDELFRGRIPPLVVPEGTTVRLSGETNLPMSRGALSWHPPEGEADGGGAGGPQTSEVALDLDGRSFAVSWTPRRPGSWQWEMDAEGTTGDPILPEPIQISVVQDREPEIRLLFPSPDTILGQSRVMPLIASMEDDHGLRRAYVRSWRSGMGGNLGEVREVLAPEPMGAPRAVFRHVLDRSAESFLPGDTLFYRFEAFDGMLSRGAVLSEIFLLRVPTFSEIRQQRADQTEDLSDAARDLEEAAEELAELAADAARRTNAEGDDSEEVRFESTEEARGVLDEAERSQEELDDLAESMEEALDELGASPFADPALEEQLRRLAERYEELAESGLGGVEELAEALRELDPAAVRDALERLAEQYEDLREAVEQTLGMLDQAALEQGIKAAETQAEELARNQRDVAAEESAADFLSEQEALAQQAEELAERISELEERLEAAGMAEAADSAQAGRDHAAEALGEMASAQQMASESAAGGAQETGEAERQAAERASDALEEAGSAMGSIQQQMTQQGEAAAESLARARSEAMSLAAEEGRLSGAARGEEPIAPDSWRARQRAVRQGLENLLTQLSESENEAAMLDQPTAEAAGRAAGEMDRLLERLARDGGRRLPSRAETESIRGALNELASYLLANEQTARAAQQQSAARQESVEQMNQLAQQQQAVMQETATLLMPGPTPSGREQQEEVMRRQQEIADELGEIEDPEGDLLGRPEELAEEAADLARNLELQPPTAETVERQRMLFRRMLDAGRSLEDDDLDPNQRESESATAPPRAPPPIDPDLLRGLRFPLPDELAIRDLPLVYRALIIEYFERLNREALAGGGARRDPG